MIPASEAYVMPLGEVTVKARAPSATGKRVIEVEASSEAVDSQGDVVLQQALLDSADSFVRSGHIDMDHLSELGHRLGIKSPESYIIGRPTEVTDLGKKRTGVVGEIMRSSDGNVNPEVNRFDAFWKSMESDPPVKWSASIYGFPTEMDDCTEKACSNGATRYVIKAIDWRSLAVTRNPINQSLKGYAKVVTAKAMIEAYRKGDSFNSAVPCGMRSTPMNMDHMWGEYMRHHGECPYLKDGNSVAAFKDHYQFCCSAYPDQADMLAHAIMYAILRDRKRSAA